MIINKVTILVFCLGFAYAQFRPNFIIDRGENPNYDPGEISVQDDIGGRFKHSQSISMAFSLFRGAPLSMYSYTNVFSYDIREDLVADVKVHGRFIDGAYRDLWGSEAYTRPHLAMDAGVRYSPMNNGVFDIHARTYHDEWWSGQSIYLTFLGIPIKRLYKSRSFDHYYGPNPLD